MTYERNQVVEVKFPLDGTWQRARIHRVYDQGADVIVGTRGCWYVSFADIREVT
jgi:hypothetical protein